MRIFGRISVAIAAVSGFLLLSACSNTWSGMKSDVGGSQTWSGIQQDTAPVTETGTWQGIKTDMHEMSEWAHGKPSSLEKNFGRVPTGYAKRKKRVMEPARVARLRSTTNAGPVWTNTDNYTTTVVETPSALPPPLPFDNNAPLPLVGNNGSARAVKYNDSVTIFPLDGETPAALPKKSRKKKLESGVSGEMVERVFFAHGSAKISTVDRRSLHELAESLVHTTPDQYHLSVVGHASKRVNNVTDPMKKRMINFAVAQKRANAVTSEMRKAGVKPNWVIVSARGDEEPNPNPGDKSQEAADRRVEVYLDQR